MVVAFEDGFSAVKAIKEEFEEASVNALRAKSRLEALKKIIDEKEAKTAELEKENGNLDDKIVSLTSQDQALDSTIQHYRDVKR